MTWRCSGFTSRASSPQAPPLSLLRRRRSVSCSSLDSTLREAAVACKLEPQLSGRADAFGLAASWKLDWRGAAEGASPDYAGELVVPAASLQLRAGFENGAAWQSSLCGLVRQLKDGDDAQERAVLSTAVRNGTWAAACLQGRLHAELSGSAPELSLRIPGSPVSARLLLSGGAPSRLEMQLHSGGCESWAFPSWPTEAVHTDAAGQVTRFWADGARTVDAPLNFAPPVFALPPPFAASSLHIARCTGGQLLVRATLPEGWLVLDPCCDGSVLTRQAADAAGFATAGSIQLTALGGSAEAPLRLGPLTVGGLQLASQPHAQLALDGAVLGAPAGAAVAGILGSSVLLRCAMLLRLPRREPGSRDPATPTATIISPDGLDALLDDRTRASFQAVRWIDGAPHVNATLRMGDGCPPFEGLFRLALGVGGAGLILAASAARRAGFVPSTVPLVPSGLMAGPGENRARLAPLEASANGQAPTLLSGRVEQLELRGWSAQCVRTLVHETDPADLALSLRADGLICADMLRGVALTLDLSNDRAAFVPC